MPHRRKINGENAAEGNIGITLGVGAALGGMIGKWLFSWIIAVTIHELSHYLILKLCRVQIYAISITSSGAIIETEPMPVYKEIISALAGPLGGLCVLSLARYFPVVAICAFFQSIFNLLPIYPLDGGRALHCCFLKMLGEERGSVSFIRFQKYFTFFIVLLSIIASCITKLPILTALVVTLLLKHKQLKFPCKEEKQIVQ